MVMGSTSPVTAPPPPARGDTVVLAVTATVEGMPFDLTGQTLRFTAKRSPTWPTPVIQKDNDLIGGVSLAIGPDGVTQNVALVTLDPTDTVLGPAPGDVLLYWDLKVKDASGHVETLVDSTLVLEQSISGSM